MILSLLAISMVCCKSSELQASSVKKMKVDTNAPRWENCIKDVGTQLHEYEGQQLTGAKWLRTHGHGTGHVSFAGAHIDEGYLVITPPGNIADSLQDKTFKFRMSDITFRDDLEAMDPSWGYLMFEYSGDHQEAVHPHLRYHFLPTELWQIQFGEKHLGDHQPGTTAYEDAPGGATDATNRALAEIRQAVLQAGGSASMSPTLVAPAAPAPVANPLVVGDRLEAIKSWGRVQAGWVGTVKACQHKPKDDGKLYVYWDQGSAQGVNTSAKGEWVGMFYKIVDASEEPKYQWQRYLAAEDRWVPIIPSDETDMEELGQRGGGRFANAYGSYELRKGGYAGQPTAEWHQINTQDVGRTWAQGARMATVRRARI